MDILIFVLLYLAMLGKTVTASLKASLVSDAGLEYSLYEQVRKGDKITHWLKCCITTIYVPAILQRITHLNPYYLFRISPCLLYSLLPAFVYLTARCYLDMGYALLAVFLVLSSFYIAYDAVPGRWQVAVSFASGMMWSLVSGNVWLSPFFAIGIVLSHYGMTYHLWLALGGAWLVFVGLKRELPFDMTMIFAIYTLIVLIWGHIMMKSVGRTALGFIKQALTGDSNTLDKPLFGAVIPGVSRSWWAATEAERAAGIVSVDDAQAEAMAKALGLPYIKHLIRASRLRNFFKLEHREGVIQAAFGMTWNYMTLPQKIEWFLSWCIVILLSMGVITPLIKGNINELTLLSAMFYLSIIATVIIPHVSVYYGTMRVYFSSIIILAIPFASGLNLIFGVQGLFIGLVLLAAYAITSTGLLYRMMGIHKGIDSTGLNMAGRWRIKHGYCNTKV